MCLGGGQGAEQSVWAPSELSLPAPGCWSPPPGSLPFILLFLSLPAFIPGLCAAAEILNLPQTRRISSQDAQNLGFPPP